MRRIYNPVIMPVMFLPPEIFYYTPYNCPFGVPAYKSRPYIIAYAEKVQLLPKFRSEEHTSELQSQFHLECRLPLVKLKTQSNPESMLSTACSSTPFIAEPAPL